MREIKVCDNFYQYQFSDPDKILGQNIYVLFNGYEALILDAGYERHMKQLLPKLEGYKINYVICTHFHPDHCYGLNELNDVEVIGSVHGFDTLKMFNQENNSKLTPSHIVSNSEVLFFGEFRIELIPNKGHSNCGLLININDRFLLVGDEFMTTNDDDQVLPYVAETITQHINSLREIINNYSNHVILPSHGVITTDTKGLNRALDYLCFAETGEKDLSKFYKDDFRFLSDKWHESNISRS